MLAQTSQRKAVQPHRKSRAKPKDEKKQKGWSTREQDDFLQEYLPKYKLVQATQKFDAFWIDVSNAFNDKWPLDDTPDKKRQQKDVCLTDTSLSFFILINIPLTQNLRSWFNNKTWSGKNKVRPDLLMFKKTTKSKLRHDFQAFSKMHYEDLVQKAVTEAWDDALDDFNKGRIDKKPNNLTVIQKVTKAIFTTQFQAVKDEARKYRLAWNKVIDKSREPGIGEDEAADSEDAEEAVERCHIVEAEQYLAWVVIWVFYIHKELYLW